MLGTKWYRSVLLIMSLIIVALLIAAALVWLYERPLQVAHSIEVMVVERTVEVVKEVEVEAEAYEWSEFTVTGYTADDPAQGTNNVVYTGFDLNKTGDLPIAAVDPDTIPLYSIIEIKDVGAFVALDTGGAIKGKRIDILFEDIDQAYQWGVQERLVRVIGGEV